LRGITVKELKGILEKQLEQCRQKKVTCDEELSKLPKGSLVKKKIREWQYHYLVYRGKTGKVCSDYFGRASEETLKKYDEAKKQRAHYRHLRSKLKKEIQLLEKTLRKKSLRSVVRQ
jgi:hypothetical protein